MQKALEGPALPLWAGWLARCLATFVLQQRGRARGDRCPGPRLPQGRRVVRLKGGCPSVFGRLHSELAALGAAGVTVEIVPGVSSALAAPLAAGEVQS